jgi:Uma2 family endonuclease
MSTARLRRPVTRLKSVAYDTYVRLRQARGNRGLRMAYHDGVLEIMSPEYRHDRGSRRLYDVVAAYCIAFDVPCEAAGSTTFSKGEPGEPMGKGKEADESFYVGKEAVEAILGKDTLDLDVDPPPSLWVEVDNWGSSKAKLPLYAGLGVSEVWRYRARKNTLWIGRLAGDGYEEAAASGVLPGLTPAMVCEVMREGASMNLTDWRRFLEGVWFPANRQAMIDRGAGR